MNGGRRHQLILAIYPSTRGFAFVLFEGALSPVNWGFGKTPGPQKNKRALRRIVRILARSMPDLLVLQDTSDHGTRRVSRIRKLNWSVAELAERHGIPMKAYTREDVRRAFSYLGHPTKDAIAEEIVKHIPIFERHRPPIRRAWMNEDIRMTLFDATALAITHFAATANDEPHPG